MTTTHYNNEFYDLQSAGSYNSAKVVVPYIVNLLHPKSVVDVGCGIGTWLKAFKENGVEQTTGIDGDYVDRRQLLIPEKEFLPMNLSQPINLNRKFDLAISLEVAEHIEERYAETFVRSLIALSDVIVFSAAVPFQRGTNHINEQLPGYWKSIFERNNYKCYDIFRGEFWNVDINIEYRQNMFLYANSNLSFSFPKKEIFDFVHPEMMTQATVQGEKYADSILAGSLGVKSSLGILLKSVKFFLSSKFSSRKK